VKKIRRGGKSRRLRGLNSLSISGVNSGSPHRQFDVLSLARPTIVWNNAVT